MTNVTDLTGSEVIQSDETSVQVVDDSNINVYEFGNILLAGILPAVSSLLKHISDSLGSAGTISDKVGSSVSLSKTGGSSNTVVDISGS